MSWKSIVITGLLCVVASPVWAAPGLVVDLLRSGGLPVLDANGDWQWVVSVDPDDALFADNPPNGVGGSVAVELNFAASDANLVSAAKNATNFPADNPGSSANSATGEGLVTNANDILAAIGSTYFTDGAAKEAIIIKTAGPSTVGSLSTTLAWSGAYSGNGRIAQAGQNFDTFAGSITKTVLGGDANLNGSVTVADYNVLLANFGQAGKNWSTADFNGSGNVTVADYNVLLANFGQSAPAPGGGSASVVPEPASAVLVFLGVAMMGIARRRR